jgi:hypothetical protein
MPTWARADTQPWFSSAIGVIPPPPPVAPAPSPQWGTLFQTPGVPDGPEPANLLWWSIAVLLCCCLPGGIVGIIYGNRAKSEWARGEYSQARSTWEIGKNWLIGSSIAGLIINIIYFFVKIGQLSH